MQKEFYYKCIMIVDDNKIDTIVNKKVLEKERFAENILVFDSSSRALNYLKAINPIHENFLSSVPAIIFLDMFMPEMDGEQFIFNFEKLDLRIRNICKIVLVSGSLLTSSQESLLKHPFVVKYVGKPLGKGVLSEVKESLGSL
jgi:CheY-like chemotaxis protein